MWLSNLSVAIVAVKESFCNIRYYPYGELTPWLQPQSYCLALPNRLSHYGIDAKHIHF